MNQDDAKRLLERLRLRTESRGATAAEAAAAAELAERIIRRYGLDRHSAATVTGSFVFGQNKLPSYAAVLATGIVRRFGCEGDYRWARGERCVVRFRGPEHACRVASWLFAAVVKDLDAMAMRHVTERKVSGAVALRLRNRFRLGAAWEVYRRLNAEQLLETNGVGPSKASRTRRRRSRVIRDPAEWEAIEAGQAAGRQIQLSTDVLGGSAPDRLRLV